MCILKPVVDIYAERYFENCMQPFYIKAYKYNIFKILRHV